MLAILIYVVAAVAVVCIGLVAVGRETFIAATTLAHVTYDIPEAADWIAERLDDRTAARLTPDDVIWILRVDADRLAATADDPAAPGTDVIDEREAVDAVAARRSGQRAETIDADDIAAVLTLRSRYLENIGAIGGPASVVADETDRR